MGVLASSAFCFFSSSITSALYSNPKTIGFHKAYIMLLYLQLWRQSSRDCAHAASTDSVLPKITHFEYDRGLKGILQARSSAALYHLRTLCSFGLEKKTSLKHIVAPTREACWAETLHGWINDEEFLQEYVGNTFQI